MENTTQHNTTYKQTNDGLIAIEHQYGDLGKDDRGEWAKSKNTPPQGKVLPDNDDSFGKEKKPTQGKVDPKHDDGRQTFSPAKIAEYLRSARDPKNHQWLRKELSKFSKPDLKRLAAELLVSKAPQIIPAAVAVVAVVALVGIIYSVINAPSFNLQSQKTTPEKSTGLPSSATTTKKPSIKIG
jgi:hypothetical protein